MPNFTKTDIPSILKDTKEIPMQHLILPAYKSSFCLQILYQGEYTLLL